MEDVIVTNQLDQRAARSPDLQTENRAFAHLLKALLAPRHNVLQELAESALHLCQADSAGISIAEKCRGRDVFRWRGTAGACAPFVNRTIPRESSPSGVAVDRNGPLLISEPERFFNPTCADLPPLVESLLVPIRLEGAAIGTIWVVAHDGSRQFDREDLRLLSGLSDVASIACQLEERAWRDERHAFLLRLSDVEQQLPDARDILATAARMLGEQIGAPRVSFNEIADHEPKPDDGAPNDALRVTRQAAGEGAAEILRECARGENTVVDDVHTDPRLLQCHANYEAAGVHSFVIVPLVADDRWLAALSIESDVPRAWRDNEIALAREVVKRSWQALENTRASMILRESERRFRQFAEASSGVLWIRNATTLATEYVSPAVRPVYGITPDAALGNVRQWAATIVPDDRRRAFDCLERAQRGEDVVYEYRIQRLSDSAFRWIRHTDFPLLDDRGHVHRIGGIAEDVTEARLAVGHQGVLLAELQHRVRNLIAVIRSVVSRTGERAESVGEYAALVTGRLTALARVQALLTRAANIGIGLRTIAEDQLRARAQHEGQYDLSGPDLILSPKVAEVLTLAVHELATNALKYGSLATPAGHVSLGWTLTRKHDAPWLALSWVETGAPERPPAREPVPRRRGFGSELIEQRIPYELGGNGKLDILPGGARCQIEFPLLDRPSFLETDAPALVTVFGGAIDAADEANLSGQRILIVEDDFYLANDTAHALRSAGASVLGPCQNEEAALKQMDTGTPTAALVDINLGAGISFETAHLLRKRDIPFVFVTGYDNELIPSEFADVARLQKPVEFRQVVSAIAKAIGSFRPRRAPEGPPASPPARKRRRP